MIRIFMKDNTIVSLGVPMLRMQLLGMVFVAIVLVTTCTFQSAGMARNAFLLSISRQGVIFAIVLAVAGYFRSADRCACYRPLSDKCCKRTPHLKKL